MSTPKSWWAKRWPRTLEPLGLTYPDTRIVRARTLLRSGAVDDLLISPGELTAWVDQPRRTYGVSIHIPTLNQTQWTDAYRDLATRLSSLADLLDDRLPENIDRTLNEVNLTLFPRDGELTATCPCNDHSGLCVHVIAVHHAFATRFDDDPFLLPLLRGRNRNTLLDGIRSAMSVTAAPNTGQPAGITLATLNVDTFYDGTREALSTQ